MPGYNGGAGGRPTKYTKQIADEICERISLGETLVDICKSPHIPNQVTVIRWTYARPEFCKAYARARLQQQHSWADQILAIADDESRDYYFDAKGERHSDNTSVNRDRLRSDNRKWLMARLAANVYGDKVTNEHTGANGGPIQYSQLVDKPTETVEQWQERVAKEMAAKHAEQAKTVH